MKSCLPALAFTLLLVTGCQTTPEPPPQPERLSQKVARDTLERAQQAYDEGDYAKAITTLKSGGVSVFEGAEPATRQSAMKLEAFSYCVSNQIPECRTQFRKILDVFPNFELNVAERKHPVWGPAFEAAKRMKR
ncbi:TssQ family T6SS-associated lipoprotein [Variovorax sp. IB41]|uniref:TssQ family T6SS-associated lipoprotein n=1 Tax=Variovorax sp. IB41 TaxID=2779370 RepID=UPI0018E8DBD8|nr:TssQ family T6SS-associated lipoprotein [Variovorax sp. IB41]MBJ2159941.1 TssQ family T6SS-associated lipoprotein [Variovorax sp. IB41]